MFSPEFDNIPSQLEEKNRRFRISSLNSSARIKDLDDSFLWLKDAGVEYPCFNLTEPRIPLKINKKTIFSSCLRVTPVFCAVPQWKTSSFQ